MRAILTNFGSRGDIQPLLSLGNEMRTRGHEPIFALPAGFEGLIGPSGFEYRIIGPNLSEIRDWVNLRLSSEQASYSSNSKIADLLMPFQAHFGEVFEGLSDACEDVDVLVSGPMQPLARMIHEISGIPFVSVQLCHFGGNGGSDLTQAGRLLINPFRRDLGLPPLKDPLTTGMNSPQLALYAMSTYLRPRPSDWPHHYQVTGFFFDHKICIPDAGLAEYVDSGSAPVVITFGSMIQADRAKLLEKLIGAVHISGCRAVIQGFDELATDIPADPTIYWAGSAPHTWLFERAACVVLHGGAGTSAAIFRAGVPGVFVPHGDFYDQRYWAQLAGEIGCALPAIPYEDLTTRKLAKAIRQSIEDDSLHAVARSLATKVRRERGTEIATRLIEKLVTEMSLT